MTQFIAGGKTVSVCPGAEDGSPVVYFNTFGNDWEEVYRELRKESHRDFSFVAISGLQWNHDMTPWEIPPISKGDIPCTGGANQYLELLTTTIMPKAESMIPGQISWRGLAGYSLAGLFAVYSMYQTDVFSRIASVSGSLWFPGFYEYIQSNHEKRKPDCIYFSIGDRECRTRNPFLKPVQERTEAIHAFYMQEGIDTEFQLNPGNHFQDEVRRTAKGIAWILNRQIFR